MKNYVETIAVYREERVKVYGISAKTGLALGLLQFSLGQMTKYCSCLQELDTLNAKFELVTCQSFDSRCALLHILVDSKQTDTLQNTFQQFVEDDSELSLTIQYPVDLLYLHGPHFQDRDGIAEIAFSVLKEHSIKVLVAGCAGTSMYLVVPEDLGPTAKAILTDTFLIPTSK